jgi:hypothetical protein
VVKKLAVYGSYETKVPVRQRYWKRRKDGVKQRYWKTTTRRKTVTMKGRYEFYGTGRDLRKAVGKAYHQPPKGYIDVPAENFLLDPERYSSEGSWVDRDVESR